MQLLNIDSHPVDIFNEQETARGENYYLDARQAVFKQPIEWKFRGNDTNTSRNRWRTLPSLWYVSSKGGVVEKLR